MISCVNSMILFLCYRLKECPSGSLVRLDVIDLLKRSSAFKECQDETRKVFKAKYDNSLVVMRGLFDETRSDIELREESLYFTSLSEIKNLLIHFGDLIRQIRVSFNDIGEAQSKEIMQYVNDKCSNTLETLSLEIREKNVLRELRDEFQNVFALKLSGHLTNEIINASEIIQLSMIFPNLQELELDSTTLCTIIDEVMPKLLKLSVQLPEEKEANEASSIIIKFLQNNQQIKHLSVQHGSLELLKEVNRTQLESLNLIGFAENHKYYEGDSINFETVRDLSIDLGSAKEIPTKIMFKQLDRLRFAVQREFTKQWLQFMETQINPNLKQLDMDLSSLSLKHFLNLPEKLPELRVVKISCDSEFAANDVDLWMKKSQQINDFVLNIRMNSFEQNRLQQLLAKDWQVTYQPNEDETVLIDIKPKRYN